jgi:hypothetical protein
MGMDLLQPSGSLAVDLRNRIRNRTEEMIPNAIADRNTIDTINTFVFLMFGFNVLNNDRHNKTFDQWFLFRFKSSLFWA